MSNIMRIALYIIGKIVEFIFNNLDNYSKELPIS